MNMNKRARGPKTILLLGISGSGKGTQTSRLLQALPGSVNLSTGRTFRRIASRPNTVGRFIQSIMRSGGRVPYWGPAYVWLNAFFEQLRGDEPVIFDGSPRSIAEARMIDDFMGDIGRSLPTAIYIVLSEREAQRRLLKRRRTIDDRLKAVRRRFAWFTKDVRPVIAYYRRRGRLITVNGAQPVPAVWRDIRKALRLP